MQASKKLCGVKLPFTLTSLRKQLFRVPRELPRCGNRFLVRFEFLDSGLTPEGPTPVGRIQGRFSFAGIFFRFQN